MLLSLPAFPALSSLLQNAALRIGVVRVLVLKVGNVDALPSVACFELIGISERVRLAVLGSRNGVHGSLVYSGRRNNGRDRRQDKGE